MSSSPAEAPIRVFISYSHDSAGHRETVLAFADRLRADGIDATIDQYVMVPPEGWPVWMEKQIRESDFVILVCTESYQRRAERREEPGKGHGVMWESVLSYQYIYDVAQNTKFIPVLLDGALPDDIPAPLRSTSHYRPNTQEGYEELYRRLTNQPFVEVPVLGKYRSLPHRQRQTTRTKSAQPWTVPHERNPVFTGREEILNQLRADLLKNGRQALSGLGGIGKTQIAVEYAYRYRDEYDAVLWTFADSEQSVITGFANIARQLDLLEKDSAEQATVIHAVKRWLQENEKWLLVFDNADTPGILIPTLPHQPKGHILLTSRAHVFQGLGILKPLEISVLTPTAAVEFLLKRTSREGTTESIEVEMLAKELGFLPLALEQAAAYVVENQSSFKDYLASYKKQRLKLLAKQGPALGTSQEQQKRTVATTWAVNFQDVEKNSPASANLLRLSAFLAPDAIPLELLEKGGEEMTEHLASVLAKVPDDPLIVDELLKPLTSYSLVRRSPETRSYSIHPLVQEVIREGMSEEAKKSWAETAVKALDSAFPHNEFQNWPDCDRLLPHFIVCAGLIEQCELAFEASARLLNKSAGYLKERAQFAQAEQLLIRSLAIREKVLGSEHLDVAQSLNNLARLCADQGKYAEAAPLYQRSLTILEKASKTEDPDAATVLNNLADISQVQGRYEEAEHLQRRCLAIREKVLGAEHPDTATGLNNLALLYAVQGRYTEAAPLYQRSLAICEKASGTEHPHTATVLDNLAELYRSQSRDEEAEPLQRRSLAIREKVLGAEHPDTAGSLNNLAGLYAAQGKYTEAAPLYERSLAICEKALGAEHPSTATILNNRAELYRSQSRDEEAEPLYRRSLAIREKVLGAEHLDTATSLNNLASLYKTQGKYTQAEPLYQRSLAIREKALGTEHPDTASSLNNLAVLYYDQGQYTEAEPLYRRAVDAAQKARGTKHPHTKLYAKNLISCYRAQGKLKEAEQLEQQVGKST